MDMVHDQAAFLLSGMSLFSMLTPAQVEALAADFEVYSFETGETIYSQGDVAEGFFVVFSGKVTAVLERQEATFHLGTFLAGDHFGEEALLQQNPRRETVKAVAPTRLLRLNSDKFFHLVGSNRIIRRRLFISLESRLRARERNPNWLSEEETIFLYLRKDKAFLILVMIPPVILAWVGLGILYFSNLNGMDGTASVGDWISYVMLLVAFLWSIWVYLDWRNDYYIVTNERVIWLERVIFFYDSRQEAPMDTVLTVGIKTDFIGRLLDFGEVRVKTYTGQIQMINVGHPEYMLSVIEEFVSRTKQYTKQVEEEALEREIRKRLGLPVGPEPIPRKVGQLSPPPAQQGANPFRFLLDIFKVRTEEEGVVTYRKHWLILIRHIWASSLLLLAGLALLAAGIFRVVPLFSSPYLVMLWMAYSFGVFLWWLYGYVDWRNDIYQVTEEHIVDVYKKPLGEVDRKSASLENILSLHHEQLGLIRLILNYGDVVAMVGTARFTFTGVYNPAEVVQDIFLRMNARKRRLREIEAARERERVADWMAAYHRQSEDLRRNGNSSDLIENSE
jgi:hypothetical protein